MSVLDNIKIARVSTVPFFVASQLKEQLIEINRAGAEVSIITSPANSYEDKIEFPIELSTIEIEIPRKIELINDFIAFCRLISCFRKNKFDFIHSTTPKAGLLCALAGAISRVPFRLHTFTGQTWVEKKGLSRYLFKMIDRLIIKLNTNCYADSKSQVDFLISENVCGENDVVVLGSGSLAGVNISRFDPAVFSEQSKVELRNSLGLKPDSFVLIFVGRIAIDKGILELIKAYNLLRNSGVNVTLLLVGPIDDNLNIDGQSLEQYVTLDENIKLIGFTTSPESYLSISDVFCLPSYREGFGTVIIESASMGLPSVVSNIYGLSDSVQDGETGFLIELKNVSALFDSLRLLATDHELRARMGAKARERAITLFSSSTINSLVVSEYNNIIEKRNER